MANITKHNPTTARAVEMFQSDLRRLHAANKERGDSWRSIGAMGLFLEVRTMYLRLRGLLWDKLTTAGPGLDALDVAALSNALQDLRNYAVLLEMSILDKNIKGDEGDESL